MNIMEQTPAAIQVRIIGMTWEQVREMIEERFGALMWDHRSVSYPAEGVTVQMVFAEPTADVSKRALSRTPQPPAEAQEPVDSLGIPLSCGKPLCSPGNHHPLCKLYAHPAPQQAAPAEGDALAQAARDVLAERQRQISVKGWTPEHDDEHVNDEIAAMAALYILPDGARDWDATSTSYGETLADAVLPIGWDMPTFGDRRRELVKGAAMALAEIERLDRAAQKGSAA